MTAERFYAKADRVGDCLIWSGKGRIGPYGVAGYQGTGWLAHRLSYFLAHGPIPENMAVRHTCDTPLFVEPSHLILGTHAENVADKVERGRQQRHEHHPAAVLTAEQGDEIREAVAAGQMQKTLAAQYGISRQQVSKIVRSQRWKAA